MFLLAIGWQRANGNGAFIGLIAGMAAVGVCGDLHRIAFLWLNVVGAVSVFVVGVIVSAILPGKRSSEYARRGELARARLLNRG